ncbi:MAG TPA: MFS transporter, partial [Candidatus Brocadiia bacterium]|nr:MFS transporter [Candidatus Brocadiia bacterium]
MKWWELDTGMGFDRYALRAACFYGICVFALSAQVMPPGLSSIGVEFGLGESAQGMMLALQYGGFFVTSVVGGAVSDRWGRKPLLVAGLYMTTAGLAVAPLAGTAWVFGVAM